MAWIVEVYDGGYGPNRWDRPHNKAETVSGKWLDEAEFATWQEAEAEATSQMKISSKKYRATKIGTDVGNTTVFVSPNFAKGESNDMFQVTIYNHATGAVTNAAFKTLDEAQVNLNQQVAGFRSAVYGTNRVFFTASLLDTRSGKYYGSVSDAPPPVTLTV